MRPMSSAREPYSLPLMKSNLSLIAVPSAFTAVMMATAIPEAISAYSIAVAPDSSCTKLLMTCTERLLVCDAARHVLRHAAARWL